MTDERSRESSICIGCGLCCDGTLFVRGHLTAGEARRIPAAQKIGAAGNKASFRQPCVHFDGSACRIYADRYAACRTYQCELLKAHMRGSIDAHAARARIAEAHELIAKVSAADPEARKWEGRQKRWGELAEAVKSPAGDDRPALGRRLLNIVALDTFLDKHFRKKQVGGGADPPSR